MVELKHPARVLFYIRTFIFFAIHIDVANKSDGLPGTGTNFCISDASPICSSIAWNTASVTCSGIAPCSYKSACLAIGKNSSRALNKVLGLSGPSKYVSCNNADINKQSTKL